MELLKEVWKNNTTAEMDCNTAIAAVINEIIAVIIAKKGSNWPERLNDNSASFVILTKILLKFLNKYIRSIKKQKSERAEKRNE